MVNLIKGILKAQLLRWSEISPNDDIRFWDMTNWYGGQFSHPVLAGAVWELAVAPIFGSFTCVTFSLPLVFGLLVVMLPFLFSRRTH